MKKVLIAVIAIVAVIALVLGAMYVIGQNNYKERSNMAADESAMAEIANVILLSVLDENVGEDICKEISANLIDGEMSIAFQPTSGSYTLSDGIVNLSNGGTTTLKDCPALYDKIISAIGETVELKSKTYKEAEYVIRVPATVENEWSIKLGAIRGEFSEN